MGDDKQDDETSLQNLKLDPSTLDLSGNTRAMCFINCVFHQLFSELCVQDFSQVTSKWISNQPQSNGLIAHKYRSIDL